MTIILIIALLLLLPASSLPVMLRWARRCWSRSAARAGLDLSIEKIREAKERVSKKTLPKDGE